MRRHKPRRPRDSQLRAHLDATAVAAPSSPGPGPPPAPRGPGTEPGAYAVSAEAARGRLRKFLRLDVAAPGPRSPRSLRAGRKVAERAARRAPGPWPAQGARPPRPSRPRAPAIGRGARCPYSPPLARDPQVAAVESGRSRNRSRSRSWVAAGRRVGRPRAAAAAAARQVGEAKRRRRLHSPRSPSSPAVPQRRLGGRGGGGFIAAPAGRSFPAPARRDAPTPAAASRLPPPNTPSRGVAPGSRRETRRARGAAPAPAGLHVGRRGPGVCGDREGPKGSRRVPRTLASRLGCPLGETRGCPGTVPTGLGDGDNGARSRPGRGRAPLETLRRVPRSRLLVGWSP
uniref:atherin-like n=1 Tax=Odobenus rosmarus divergens TaxID=9708 RepID=UPI00063CE130|nr:PREDICTED: atherin-like [Odobenus rosmarus divergens]